MTALAQYRRLEATGLWHETPDAQRREVVVALGDATLVISSLNDSALTHWSLPALTRLNPGKLPALYAPGDDTEERLELTDAEMIAAIEKLRGAIARARPRPGRLRLWIGLGLGAAALVLTVVWLPDALTRQTVAMLPEASRAEIGRQLLDEMTRIAGQPCNTPRGREALGLLSQRGFGDMPPRIVILPTGIPETVFLPGGTLVAHAALVEDHETPEVMAGYLLAEGVRSSETDPMLSLLEDAGLSATFRLLTTGAVPEQALRSHAAGLLATPRAPVDQDALLERFAMAQVSSEPYAYARDVSGESTLALIEADPMRGIRPPPLLSDAAWLSLQEICTR